MYDKLFYMQHAETLNASKKKRKRRNPVHEIKLPVNTNHLPVFQMDMFVHMH